MPLATRERYRAMLDAAHAGGFAYPAVDVTSARELDAALEGFAAAGSDGIVGVTMDGAAAFGSGDALAGAQEFAALAHERAERVEVAVALHSDRCPPDREQSFLRPLIATGRFASHAFDGSSLPLEENLKRSRALLELGRDAGVVLEIEVGGDPYTAPEDLLHVAQTLGSGCCGRYLLAARLGDAKVRLRPEILRDGQRVLASRGGHFDYAFHGGAREHELNLALGYGVVKVDLDPPLEAGRVADACRRLGSAR